MDNEEFENEDYGEEFEDEGFDADYLGVVLIAVYSNLENFQTGSMLSIEEAYRIYDEFVASGFDVEHASAFVGNLVPTNNTAKALFLVKSKHSHASLLSIVSEFLSVVYMITNGALVLFPLLINPNEASSRDFLSW